MKHLILGEGNLGNALKERLGDDAAKIHLSRVYQPGLAKSTYETIWYCVGAGSVSEGQQDPAMMMRTHVEYPLQLAKAMRPDQRLVVFSSDYAEQFQLSHYAMSKYFMELALEPFPNTHCFRVSSLYGSTRPEKTFPYKILTKILYGERVRLSRNMVMPTPVEWLADQAVKHLEIGTSRMAYLVPQNPMPAYAWAQMVVATAVELRPNLFKEKAPNIDPEYYDDRFRPMEIQGRSRFAPDAFGFNNADFLWSKHGPALVAKCLEQFP